MKKTLFTALLALTLVGSIAVVGQSAEDAKKKAEPINDKCPISGRDVNPEKTSEVKVGFCCNNCKGKFDKALKTDAAAATKILGKVKSLDKCPVSGRDVSEKANTTVAVGLCCGNCQGKLDKALKNDGAAASKIISKVKVKKSDG